MAEAEDAVSSGVGREVAVEPEGGWSGPSTAAARSDAQLKPVPARFLPVGRKYLLIGTHRAVHPGGTGPHVPGAVMGDGGSETGPLAVVRRRGRELALKGATACALRPHGSARPRDLGTPQLDTR